MVVVGQPAAGEGLESAPLLAAQPVALGDEREQRAEQIRVREQ